MHFRSWILYHLCPILPLVAACGSDDVQNPPTPGGAGGSPAIDAGDGQIDAQPPDGSGSGGGALEGGSGSGGVAGGGGSAGGSGTGGGGSAGMAGGAGAAGAECAGTGGPTMVRLTDGFCIDSTEVTRGQYAEWLKTNPSLAGQPVPCAANSTFETDPTCMQDPLAYQGANAEQHPQVCVDWCDAYAYCLAVGKRLCGQVGGGALPFTAWGDAKKSQWYAACSSGGTQRYPYGNAYNPAACNGADSGNTTSVASGSLLACQSTVQGYQAVFDLSGNVFEWEDSCVQESDNAFCSRRGGGFTTLGSEGMACDDTPFSWRRNDRAPSLGFRCCSL